MGRLIEGFWDCPYCGEKHISGLSQKCPVCGKIRDASTKFYMDGQSRYLTPGSGEKPKNARPLLDNGDYLTPEEEEKKRKGPDWLCTYCNSYNSADEPVCKHCGHGRDEEDPTYHQQQKKNYEEREEPREYYDPPYESPFVPSDPTPPEPPEPPSRSSSSLGRNVNWSAILPKVGIGAAILGFIALMVFLFMPKNVTLTADSVEWNYRVEIEELKTFNESDWSLPAGARLHRTASEIHHYEQVLDHMETKTRQVAEQVLDGYDTVVTGYSDNGNGTFTENTTQVPRYRTEYRTETYEEPVYRDEPVYQTKYYYEIDRWTHTRNVDTTGTDKDPYYGEVTLAEKEREGAHIPEYKLYCHNDKDKEFTYTLTEEEWRVLEAGQTFKAKVNNAGGFELITES